MEPEQPQSGSSDGKMDSQDNQTEQETATEPDLQSMDTNTSSTDTQNAKIDILLKATGDAPIMKKKKWAVGPDRTIGNLIGFIKRYLKLDSSESLFLYVNQAFAPAPDQTVGNVFDCFGTEGKLILYYCKSQAWG